MGARYWKICAVPNWYHCGSCVGNIKQNKSVSAPALPLWERACSRWKLMHSSWQICALIVPTGWVRPCPPWLDRIQLIQRPIERQLGQHDW